ncbi:putative membrane protein [Herbaspirillum seropedicae]|nr:putative membrane protein [Herbaspirillum seropedicae]
MIFYAEGGVNPFAEPVEIEGQLVEAGSFAWDGRSAYGAAILTEEGTLIVSGLADHDVDRLVPGVLGRVRITIEPVEDTSDDQDIKSEA